MINRGMKGAAIAAAVCSLLASGTAFADDKTKESKVKCAGVNSCKGKGGCAGASNSCAGKNGCKGKGWVEVTAKECKDKKGTVVVAPAKSSKAPKS